MRNIISVLVLSVICALAQAADAGKSITLKALFEDGGLDTVEPSGLVWLPDGEHVLYRLQAGDGVDLWREHVITGERRKVVSWSALQEDLKNRQAGLAEPRHERPQLRLFLAYGAGGLAGRFDAGRQRRRRSLSSRPRERAGAFSDR